MGQQAQAALGAVGSQAAAMSQQVLVVRLIRVQARLGRLVRCATQAWTQEKVMRIVWLRASRRYQAAVKPVAAAVAVVIAAAEQQ